MTRTSAPTSRRAVAAGLVIAAALVVACGQAPAGAPTNTSPSTEWSPPVSRPPVPEGGVKEFFTFQGLREMVAEAPTVVHGRVLDVVAGRTFGDPGAEIKMSRAIVEVVEVLGGSPVPKTIAVEEDGVFGPFLRPEDEAIMFLYPMEPDPSSGEIFYGWIGSQGRLLRNDDGVVAMNDSSDWLVELESGSWDQAIEAVRRAVAPSS